MIDLRPRETVILAEDFDKILAWYRDVLGFEVTNNFSEDYHYCNLKNASGIQIGIGSASEMGVEPQDRRRNTVILQFEVENVPDFFAYVEKSGGTVQFGPSFDKKGEFWYGGIADPEGNPCWVVDENCP